jgi:hypothetical protein
MAAMDEPPDPSTATLTDETAAIVASFDPSLFTEYLTKLAVVILDASREDLQVSLLSYPDTLQRSSRFAADANSLVLYMRKETGEAGAQNGDFPILGSRLTFQELGKQHSCITLPQSILLVRRL